MLIYYAGHGAHDRDTDEAYWLPVDADAHDSTNWISANDITSNNKAIPSQHVIIVSDSCYSGAIKDTVMRGVHTSIDPQATELFLAKASEIRINRTQFFFILPPVPAGKASGWCG